ncbi:RHS repeat-associated core domain-containing protein [Selenomonas caprae]|uniref:RHS repeat-associated core domain-containing protein n=1 Tax=Selenomonas caprae TaxID=2606905 RepID=UPI0021064148|nr:RHS repeat-associated core domain-containing protein [Selenomonas caprae]
MRNGQLAATIISGEAEEKIPNRYQYTGQELDPITQQYYLRARYYNPAIARFTQEDEYHDLMCQEVLTRWSLGK